MDAPPRPALPFERDEPDRYLTFQGIDFEGNMKRVLAHLSRYIDDPAHANAFWDRFRARLAAAEAGQGAAGAAGPRGAAICDKLLLLHAHTYYMVELFEAHDDAAALADLKTLEEQCF